MIPTFFNLPGGGQPNAMDLAQAMRGNNTFASATMQPAAAPAPAAPVISQEVKPSIGADQMQFQSQFQSQYGQTLIDKSLSGEKIGSPLEGIGRMAMLASGYYTKSKDDEQGQKRERATGDWIDKNMPELSDAYRLGDSKTRSIIADQARQTIASRAEEKRKGEKFKAETAGLINATSLDEYMKAAMESGNPALVKEALEKRLEIFKAEAAKKSAAATHQEDWNRRYEQGLKLYQGDEQLARGHAEKVEPGTILAQRAAANPYADPYETVLDPKERAKMMDSSKSTAVDNMKKINAGVQSARQTLSALDQVEAQIKGGVYTGAFGENVAMANKFMGSVFGGEWAKKASMAEVISSTQNLLAKGAKDGYPGSVSNFEYQRYLAAVPGLSNTKAGNMLIIDMMRGQAGAHQVAADAYREWMTAKEVNGHPIRSRWAGEGFNNFAREKLDAYYAGLKQKLDARLAEAEAEKNAAATIGYLKPGQNSRGGTPAAPGAPAPAAPAAPAAPGAPAPAPTGQPKPIQLNGKNYVSDGQGGYLQVD